MKKVSTIGILFKMFAILLVVAIIIGVTHFVVRLDLKIGPIIIIASVITCLFVPYRMIDRLYFDVMDHPKKKLLLLIVPVVLLLLYPLYDIAVYILVGTSPLKMLFELLKTSYFSITPSNILNANEDLVFVVFLNLIQLVLAILMMIIYYVKEVFFPDGFKWKKKDEDEDDVYSRRIKLLEYMGTLDDISESGHNKREKNCDYKYTPHVKIGLVILISAFIFVLLPIIYMVSAVVIYFSNFEAGYTILIIAGIVLQFKLTKLVILKLNATKTIIRFVLFILLPALMIAYVFYFDKRIGLIDKLGVLGDNFIAKIFNLTSESEPTEFGELILYFVGASYACILLAGLAGALTKCPKCKGWFDPYFFVERTGKSYIHTRTNVNYSVEVDDNDDVSSVTETSRDVEYYKTEETVYECYICHNIQNRKLTTKLY